MLGMRPPVDCLGSESWWQDRWCRSRYTAVDECWDIGAIPVNECSNSRESQADDIVVHSDCIGEL